MTWPNAASPASRPLSNLLSANCVEVSTVQGDVPGRGTALISRPRPPAWREKRTFELSHSLSPRGGAPPAPFQTCNFMQRSLIRSGSDAHVATNGPGGWLCPDTTYKSGMRFRNPPLGGAQADLKLKRVAATEGRDLRLLGNTGVGEVRRGVVDLWQM